MTRPCHKNWSRARVNFLLVPALFAGGCAANHGWQTEIATEDFVQGTHLLGELILSATREQALSNQGVLYGWSEKMAELGYADADIVDGSVATVWAYCYGHNSGVPLCAHHGHYVVYVPLEFRQGLNFDDNGVEGSRGDLVEIELVMTPSRKIVGKWIGVYRNAEDWEDCRIASLERDTLSTIMSILSGVGPPRAEWIECDYAGIDGWIRRPVPGAPPSAPFPVSEWLKLAGH